MTTPTSPVIFADRIDSVGAGGGVVRLNLSLDTPGQMPEEGKPLPPVHIAQVVLPMGGFAQSVQLLVNLLRQMQQAGTAARPESTAEQNPDQPLN
jgi:hypothetical protein